MREFNDYLVTSLTDPNEAELYLNTALEAYSEDGNWQAFSLALKTIASLKATHENDCRTCS